MNKLIFAVILVSVFANCLASEKLQCHAEQEEFTHDLEIELDSRIVTSIAYNSAANRYTCDVSAKRSDVDSKWFDRKNFTSIKLVEGTVVIEKKGDNLKVDLSGLSRSYYCGMNGQLAKEIVVSLSKRSCIFR